MSPINTIVLNKVIIIVTCKKGNARGAAPRSRGDGQSRKKSRRWGNLERHQAYGKGSVDPKRNKVCDADDDDAHVAALYAS